MTRGRKSHQADRQAAARVDFNAADDQRTEGVVMAKAPETIEDDDEPWRCSGCGEEIDHDGLCEDCTPEVEDEDAGYCTTCAGTGEGRYDGGRCWACGGKGFSRPAQDFDEPDHSDRYPL